MNRAEIDRILLDLRISILEIMVVDVSVAVRTAEHQYADPDAGSESLIRRAVLDQLTRVEDLTRAHESLILADPRASTLSAEERALLADEFREMIEHLKLTIRTLLPKP